MFTDVDQGGDKSPHSKVWLTAIAGATLVFGLVALRQFQQSPFARVLLSDEESYVGWARSILAGQLLPAGPLYQDPLYPYLLALWFWIFGPDPLWVRVAQVGLGAISVALAGAAASRALGRRAGLIAAGLLAGCGSLYYFELQLSKETLVIFLSALSLWVGARAVDGGRRWWLGLGLVFGLLCLTRGNFLLAAPGIALWTLVRPGAPRRSAAIDAGVLSAAIVCVLLPVSAWNYRVSGEFSLTTYSSGHNFYLGNNPDADGGYVIPNFAHGNPMLDPADFKAEAERRAGRSLTETQASGYWFGEGRRWLLDHPAEGTRLWGRKLFYLVHQRELPNLYSLALLREHFVGALWLPFLGYGWLWGPALMGMIATRRRPGAQYATALTLLYAASLLPFFVVDRYRAPLLPALALLVAGFLAGVGREWSAGGRKKVVVAVAAAAGLIGVGHVPLELPTSSRAAERALAGYAYLRSGDGAAAMSWYEEARARAPGDENIWVGWAESVAAAGPGDVARLTAAARSSGDPLDLFMIGKRLEQLERPREAAETFEAAVRLDPRNIRSYLHLAAIYTGPGWKDPGRARACLERALEIAPVDVEVWDALDRLGWRGSGSDD